MAGILRGGSSKSALDPSLESAMVWRPSRHFLAGAGDPLPTPQVFTGHSKNVEYLSSSLSADTLVSASPSRVIVWDLQRGTSLRSVSPKHGVGCIAGIPGVQLVAIAHRRDFMDNTVELWRYSGDFSGGGGGGGGGGASSSSSSMAGIGGGGGGGGGGVAVSWGPSLCARSSLLGAVTALRCMRQEEGLLAGGSTDSSICLWSVESGDAIASLGGGHSGAVTCLETLPKSGNCIFSGGADSAVCVWDIRMAKVAIAMRHHRGPIRSVCAGAAATSLTSTAATTTNEEDGGAISSSYSSSSRAGARDQVFVVDDEGLSVWDLRIGALHAAKTHRIADKSIRCATHLGGTHHHTAATGDAVVCTHSSVSLWHTPSNTCLSTATLGSELSSNVVRLPDALTRTREPTRGGSGGDGAQRSTHIAVACDRDVLVLQYPRHHHHHHHQRVQRHHRHHHRHRSSPASNDGGSAMSSTAATTATTTATGGALSMASIDGATAMSSSAPGACSAPIRVPTQAGAVPAPLMGKQSSPVLKNRGPSSSHTSNKMGGDAYRRRMPSPGAGAEDHHHHHHHHHHLEGATTGFVSAPSMMGASSPTRSARAGAGGGNKRRHGGSGKRSRPRVRPLDLDKVRSLSPPPIIGSSSSSTSTRGSGGTSWGSPPTKHLPAFLHLPVSARPSRRDRSQQQHESSATRHHHAGSASEVLHLRQLMVDDLFVLKEDVSHLHRRVKALEALCESQQSEIRHLRAKDQRHERILALLAKALSPMLAEKGGGGGEAETALKMLSSRSNTSAPAGPTRHTHREHEEDGLVDGDASALGSDGDGAHHGTSHAHAPSAHDDGGHRVSTAASEERVKETRRRQLPGTAGKEMERSDGGIIGLLSSASSEKGNDIHHDETDHEDGREVRRRDGVGGEQDDDEEVKVVDEVAVVDDVEKHVEDGVEVEIAGKEQQDASLVAKEIKQSIHQEHPVEDEARHTVPGLLPALALESSAQREVAEEDIAAWLGGDSQVIQRQDSVILRTPSEIERRLLGHTVKDYSGKSYPDENEDEDEKDDEDSSKAKASSTSEVSEVAMDASRSPEGKKKSRARRMHKRVGGKKPSKHNKPSKPKASKKKASKAKKKASKGKRNDASLVAISSASSEEEPRRDSPKTLQRQSPPSPPRAKTKSSFGLISRDYTFNLTDHRNAAATKIQAMWRGYRLRRSDVLDERHVERVQWIRTEAVSVVARLPSEQQRKFIQHLTKMVKQGRLHDGAQLLRRRKQRAMVHMEGGSIFY